MKTVPLLPIFLCVLSSCSPLYRNDDTIVDIERARSRHETSSHVRGAGSTRFLLIPSLLEAVPLGSCSIWRDESISGKLEVKEVREMLPDPSGVRSIEAVRQCLWAQRLIIDLAPSLAQVDLREKYRRHFLAGERRGGDDEVQEGVKEMLRFIGREPWQTWGYVYLSPPKPDAVHGAVIPLLDRYLQKLDSLYETNVCLDSPVATQLYPSSVRFESPCYLLLRMVEEEEIERVHRKFVASSSLVAGDGNESFDFQNRPLEDVWRRFFESYLLEYVHVFREHNIVVFRGSWDGALQLIEYYQ